MGLYLIWATDDHDSTPVPPENSIRIGRDHFLAGDALADLVTDIQVAANPTSGLDEVTVITATGEMAVYGFDKAQQQIVPQSGQQLIPNDSGIYRSLGTILDTQTGQLRRPTLSLDGGQWYVQCMTLAERYPLSWSEVGDIIDVALGQFALDPRVYIWTRTPIATANPAGWQRQASHLMSYRVADLAVMCQGSLVSPVQIEIDELIINVHAVHAHCRLVCTRADIGTTDEQLILSYYDGLNAAFDDYEQANVCLVMVTTQVDPAEPLLAKSIASSAASLSIANANGLAIIQRPDDNLLLVSTLTSDFATVCYNTTYKFDRSEQAWLLAGDAAVLRLTIPPTVSNADWRCDFFTQQSKPGELCMTLLRKSTDGGHGINLQTVRAQIPFNADGLIQTDITLPPFADAFITNDRAEAMGFQSLAADLCGNSLIYGAPELSSEIEFGQILGLYQVPPFEEKINTMPPQLSVMFNDSTAQSNNAATHASTHRTINNNLNIGIFDQSVNVQVGKSWSDSSISNHSSHYATSLHVSVNVSKNELLHTSASQYNFWCYPLYKRTEGETPVGSVVIRQPIQENVIGIYSVEESTFPYDQDYEVGMLLSYVNASTPNYSETALLFHPVSLPIMANSSQATLSYNENNSTMTGTSVTSNTSINAGGSLSLHGGGSFWKVSDTFAYHQGTSEGSNSSTNLTLTTGFSLNYTFGSVRDDIYNYEVTPLAYRDTITQVVRTKYTVSLRGIGWRKYYATPNPVLFRLLPFSSDRMAQCYSRSIRFTPIGDEATAQISLQVFNNSLNACDDLVIDLYDGLPKIDKLGRVIIDESAVKLASLGPLQIPPAQCTYLDVQGITVAKHAKVTACITSSTSTGIRDVYWGCYPYADLDRSAEKTAIDF